MSRRRRVAPIVAAALLAGFFIMWCARPMRSQTPSAPTHSAAAFLD